MHATLTIGHRSQLMEPVEAEYLQIESLSSSSLPRIPGEVMKMKHSRQMTEFLQSKAER